MFFTNSWIAITLIGTFEPLALGPSNYIQFQELRSWSYRKSTYIYIYMRIKSCVTISQSLILLIYNYLASYHKLLCIHFYSILKKFWRYLYLAFLLTLYYLIIVTETSRKLCFNQKFWLLLTLYIYVIILN